MKTTRHSLMAKGIMVLLSLLVLAFMLTYSWILDKPSASASGISGNVIADGDFEYAIGFYNSGTDNQYAVSRFTSDSTALDLKHLVASVDGGTTYTEYDLLHDYKPIDLTGDGPTLIRPSMMHGNIDINASSDDYSIAKPNEQYISFDLYFRSEIPGVSVYLANGSFARAACETTLGNISLRSTVNQSTYGTFSKDAIVGAARIAIIPYTYPSGSVPDSVAGFQSNSGDLDGDNTLVWLPRPDIHTNATNTTTGWSLSYGTYPDSVSDPTYSDNTPRDDVHYYYDIFESNSTKQLVPVTNTILPSTLQSANQLMSNIGSTYHYVSAAGDYYYSKVNVRIWIEGTDAQSRRAFSGGEFSINFKLSTYSE